MTRYYRRPVMDVVVALHASAAVLLLVAGMAKVLRPAPAVELLGALGLPSNPLISVAIGVIELSVGLGALGVGGAMFAAATGVLYVGFALVVLRALSVGAESCGCFGRVDAPPSRIHVVGNIALAAVSFVAVAGDSPLDVMDGQRGGGVLFVAMVGLIAGVALVAFTALPEAMSARRPASSSHSFRIDGTEEDPK